ncbi:MAG TPA: hypothetical protein ACFYD3_08330, partial [Candidatus Hypogeohydataceae bacterium YC41]
MARSNWRAGEPVPSTTVPFLMMRLKDFSIYLQDRSNPPEAESLHLINMEDYNLYGLPFKWRGCNYRY